MCGVHQEMTGKEECGMYVEGKIGQQTVEMLVDSGANISLISYEVYNDMESKVRPKLELYGIPMVTADGTPMKVYGCAEFKIEIGIN